MNVFLSSALKCVGFSNGQPRIHRGNQIPGFGCPAFEIGTTWIFFLISSTAMALNMVRSRVPRATISVATNGANELSSQNLNEIIQQVNISKHK